MCLARRLGYECATLSAPPSTLLQHRLLLVRLNILYVSQMPASPPRFGAQARLHGLMTEMARHHDVSAVMVAGEEFDIDECRTAMQVYCRDVVLVRNSREQSKLSKRLRQVQSLVSSQSFERLWVSFPEIQKEIDRLLQSKRFDVVNLESTFLGHCNLRQAPAGEKPPVVVVDSHNIDYDLARQYAKSGASLGIRAYYGMNWRKLRNEELSTYQAADGVYLCSAADQTRLRAEAPQANTVVIPNAADVEFYKPRAEDPAPDGRTVVFFGLMSYAPNIDGITYFAEKIWPLVLAARPEARCKIIGGSPAPSVKALAGGSVEVTGFVPDLRPHLASAACVVVPLRLGGGTRLKIVEGMAMGKAIVSTSLGAEGIEAHDGRHILIADEPRAFADAVIRLLDDRELTDRIGAAARKLAVEQYSWNGAAKNLEHFLFGVLGSRDTRKRTAA